MATVKNNNNSCWGGIGTSSEHMGLSHTVHVDDGLLAKEMNAMTVKERELVYEEVHGVSDIMEETPELIATSLQKMRKELEKAPKYNKKALDRALFLKPAIQSDEKFHLMFLRAERFEPFKAALKMCRYFEHKLNLFGDEKLVQRIALEDLGEKEKSLIYSGAAQFLLSNDSSGRAIFFLKISQYDTSDPKAFMRYCWFQVYSMLEENEDIQKRGVVEIVDLLGNWTNSVKEMLDFLLLAGDLPQDWAFRTCGFHLCYDQPFLRSGFSTLFAIMGKEYRKRQRIHYGSVIEIQYALLTFGIHLPPWFTSGNGAPSMEYVDLYLDLCRQREALTKSRSQNFLASNPGLVFHPKAQDVLLGRGRPYHSWYGNVHLSRILTAYADRYMHTSEGKGGKAEIAMEIIEKIRAEGGTFLRRRADNFWETVSDDVAKQKVSQNMRAEVRNRQTDRHRNNISPVNENSFRWVEDMFDEPGGSAKRPRIQ
jgi:hypothetical protein